MRLHQVSMAAGEDLAATTRFYQDVVGARHLATFDPPGLAFFDVGGVRLMFEGNSASSVLYLWVDDIDAAVAEYERRGANFAGPPHPIHKDEDGTFGPAGETEWMAFFEDPAGNTLALATRR